MRTITTTISRTSSRTGTHVRSRGRDPQFAGFARGDAAIVRFDDDAAHRCAVDHAVRALGLAADPIVVWDAEHHLQGHLDVSGHHLVLIAPRTGDHAPRLLAEDEWDAVRRGVA